MSLSKNTNRWTALCFFVETLTRHKLQKLSIATSFAYFRTICVCGTHADHRTGHCGTSVFRWTTIGPVTPTKSMSNWEGPNPCMVTQFCIREPGSGSRHLTKLCGLHKSALFCSSGDVPQLCKYPVPVPTSKRILFRSFCAGAASKHGLYAWFVCSLVWHTANSDVSHCAPAAHNVRIGFGRFAHWYRWASTHAQASLCQNWNGRTKTRIHVSEKRNFLQKRAANKRKRRTDVSSTKCGVFRDTRQLVNNTTRRANNKFVFFKWMRLFEKKLKRGVIEFKVTLLAPQWSVGALK